MRIVYLRSNPVNPDSRVEKEVNSLIKYGHAVTVLGWDRSKNYKWEKALLHLSEGTAEIYRIGIKASFGGGIKNLLALFRFNLSIHKWLIHNYDKYDCIHASDLDTGYTAYLVSNTKKKKYVYDIFDYYPDSHYFPRALRKIVVNAERETINHAEFVILCTEQRKEQIKNTSPKKIVVIHNSPSMEILKKANTSFLISSGRNKALKIGYVGILSKSRLLEEMTAVVSENTDYELHVGGFGQLESFFEKADQESANIHYYGKLDYSETLQLEQQVDVLTAIYDPSVPNHKYAAPNKFYESLMLGKPVIMVHDTGVDYLVDKYNLGATIEFSADGFKEGLKKLQGKNVDYVGISEREMDLYEKKYSWSIMEKRLVENYSHLDI